MSYMQPTVTGDDSDGDESDEEASGSHSRGLETLRFLDEAERLAQKDARKQRKRQPSLPVRKTLGQTLTWLNLAGNTALGSSSYKGKSRSSEQVFRGLDHLKELFVLNMSSSSLSILPPRSTFLALSENLRALVLSHNRLDDSSLESLPFLPNLNTLVLSNNRISKLPRALPGNVPSLAKLSLSHNDLSFGPEEDESDSEDSDSDSDDEGAPKDGPKQVKGSVALPDFSMNTALREVRLSHNPRLSRLPMHLRRWGQGIPATQRGLDLVDVGHCDLSWTTIAETLLGTNEDEGDGKQTDAAEERKSPRRGGIKNLTLAGNSKLDDEFEDGYVQKVQSQMPSLVILDNRRLVERKAKTNAEKSAATSGVAVEARTKAAGTAANAVPLDNDRQAGKKRKRGSRGGSSAAQAQAGAEDGGGDASEGRASESKTEEVAEVASDDEGQDDTGSKSKRKAKAKAKAPAEPFTPAPASGKRGKRGGKPASKVADTNDAGDADWLAHTRAAALSATTAANAEDSDGEAGGKRSKRQKRKGEPGGTQKTVGQGNDGKKRPSESPRKDGKASKTKSAEPRKAWDHVEKTGTSVEPAVSGGESGSTAAAATATTAAKGGQKQSAGVASVIEIKRRKDGGDGKGRKRGSETTREQDKDSGAQGAGSSAATTALPTRQPAALGQGLQENQDAWGTGASAWD
ncbi:unnamed protein product [Parajaminaea phylloscopi]